MNDVRNKKKSLIHAHTMEIDPLKKHVGFKENENSFETSKGSIKRNAMLIR